MALYLYEMQGGAPRYYIDRDTGYELNGRPAFYISGLVAYAHSGDPVFSIDGEYIYDRSGKAALYFSRHEIENHMTTSGVENDWTRHLRELKKPSKPRGDEMR
jgi:hypothetical protein